MRLSEIDFRDLVRNKRVALRGATLLRGAYLDSIDRSLVIIEDQKILYVGQIDDKPNELTGAMLIDVSDFVIHPGLINSHTHAAMSFFRGLAHHQHQMIERLFFPVEKSLQKEWMACLAMPYLIAGLKSGTTMFVDHYYFSDAVATAVDKLGVRGVVGETLMDLEGPFAHPDALLNAKKLIDSGAYQGRVSPAIAPHASNTCSEKLLKEAAKLSKDRNLPLHLHLAQSSHEEKTVLARCGVSPVEHAKKCGLLTDRTLAVHLIKASLDDFKTLKEDQTLVVICPSSQIIYEHLVDLRLLKASGVDFALATDCAASNDGADLWQEAKVAALFFKDRELDWTVDEAIASVTTTPLKTLKQDSSLGTIDAGKSADMVFVRKDLSCLPMNDLKANLIYSPMSSFVEHVMVEGEWILFDRKSTRICEHEYQDQLHEVLTKIRKILP